MKTAEGKTALHQAVFYNRKEIVKILLQEDLHINGGKTCLNMQDAIGKTALHHAVEDGSKEMVEILLQEGADIDCKDNDERTPLSHAAEQGMVEITGMLLYNWADHSALDKQENWETDREIHLLIEETGGERKLKTHRVIDDLINHERMAPVHYAAKNGHSEVVKIILQRSRVVVRSGKGRNCLDIAIDENQVKIVLEIIRDWLWCDRMLCNKTETEKGEPQSPMRKLIVHMPDIAREVFDRCTRRNGKRDKFEVQFDYKFLDDTLHLGRWDPSNQLPEGEPYTEDANLIKKNHPLMLMVKYKKAELLEHPLVSALLKKKWNSILLVFYLLNVMLYLLYLTMLTGFALDIKAHYQFTDISADENVCFEDHNISEFAAVAKYSVIVSAAIELFLEILELKVVFSSNLRLYLLEKENFLEWIACICSILFVVNTRGCADTGYRPEWQWTCGIISVFLVWINLLLLLQQFPLFGMYVDMLYQSIQVFMKFMPVFSLLIATFAVTFHCLFQNQDQFSTFWISFVKTTGMMIGEIDFNKIFLEEEVHFGIISYVFFYVFMLVMAIVVVNLMVGLAVDMPKFQRNANLAKKTMQVKLALEFERLSTSWIFQKCLRRLHADNKKTTETLWPNKQSWLQRKIAESWKLTEKDITKALTSGTDGASKEIAELKTEMRNMQEGMKAELQDKMNSIDSKLMTIIQSLKGPETQQVQVTNRLTS